MTRFASKWALRFAACTLIIVATATAPGSVRAADEERPERSEILDDLFDRLAAADSEEAAELVTASIVRMWSNSGSDTIDVLMDRALDAMEEEEYDTALLILDEVVDLEPGYAEGWNKRATVHFKLDHYGASISDIQRALRLEPRHFGAMSGLATILKETGREASALEVYRRVLELHPYFESAQKAVKDLTVEVEGRDI